MTSVPAPVLVIVAVGSVPLAAQALAMESILPVASALPMVSVAESPTLKVALVPRSRKRNPPAVEVR